MKVKVFLGPDEDEIYAEEMLAKAFDRDHKHKERHREKFEDHLMEELLEELDQDLQTNVLLTGMQEVLTNVLADDRE